MKKPTKRTYLTKADALSFARYIVSDERRGKLQRIAQKHAENGVIGFMPWTHALRTITETDFKEWKLWRDAGNDNF
jgi:hypothetical protein